MCRVEWGYEHDRHSRPTNYPAGPPTAPHRPFALGTGITPAVDLDALGFTAEQPGDLPGHSPHPTGAALGQLHPGLEPGVLQHLLLQQRLLYGDDRDRHG